MNAKTLNISILSALAMSGIALLQAGPTDGPRVNLAKANAARGTAAFCPSMSTKAVHLAGTSAKSPSLYAATHTVTTGTKCTHNADGAMNCKIGAAITGCTGMNGA